MATRNNYKAMLFHPDGENVSDFRDRETVQDVWDEINDMGSRWIFYPIPFVATDKTIVDTIDELKFLKGKRIKTVKKYLLNKWNESEEKREEICEVINNGYPLNLVYSSPS